MKKILSLLVFSAFIISCNDLTETNTDPNSAYTTVPATLVSYAQKKLSDHLNTPSVNSNNFRLVMQYWQETTYVDESNYDFVTRNISNNVWSSNYVDILNNLSQAKNIISTYQPTASEAPTWPVTKKNQLAIIDMQMVFVYQNLIDTFGDIPYSQSLNLNSNLLPVYDNDSAIYPLLITRLKNDIANLDVNGNSFSVGDYFYNGNVSKWKIFGNSLLLKLGITIADANPTLAQATVSQAIADGVFSSEADNCQFQYLEASPNYNPLYENLYASGRNDFVAGKTIVDRMNANNDPRISKFFDPLGNGTFVGAVIGSPASFSSRSHVGEFAYTPTTKGNVMTYTEVAFYLAEAAARWTPANAAVAYKTAVTASMLEWGLNATQATAYVTANPYNAATWKKNIGEEAWIAMYNNPYVSWNFYKRLDFPTLVAPSTAVAVAGGKVPVRLTYPIKETTTNPSNYTAASAAIGGDKLTTKIFWDVN
ncbi:SusD/RagB family nutrient-binding outer membrane lipoprotein [Flavobacterium branchiophilum]|uniref:SusD/RagB family nutrient-binding outer membrane lipoprotein n=1 Tax=Flavobacterium branchiophilum TaxID=55197 RepID=A0A2H3KF75_9FLAO|nr:SusD/RagB family nutrient-binding outer membrane lipoprotein [Flavobacterium branchiophilum]PDS25830.1 SusD/RagB family nutrient-binding outer membrane lipoprotein [Flavobacterium branchiophilum]